MAHLIHIALIAFEAAAVLWLMTPVFVLVVMLIYNLIRLCRTLAGELGAAVRRTRADWVRPSVAVQGR